jgi:hypothetical protein
VLEELGSLGIRVHGVMQLRSGRRDQHSAKDRPPTPTSLCLWHGARRCLGCGKSPNSVASQSRWTRTLRQKALYNANAAGAAAICSETAFTLLGALRVGFLTSLMTANRSPCAASVKATTQRTTADV